MNASWSRRKWGVERFVTDFGEVVLRLRRICARAVDLGTAQSGQAGATRPGARFDRPERYDDEVTDRNPATDGIAQREYDALRSALLSRID